MSSPATYTLTDAPKFSGMRQHDCFRCDHEDLRRPVFLSGPAGVVAAGTRCAAIALGLVPDTATEAQGRKALAPALKAHAAAKAAERAAAHAARFAGWDEWLLANGTGDSPFQRIKSLGGLTAASAAFDEAKAAAA